MWKTLSRHWMRKEKRWMPSYLEREENRGSDLRLGRLMQDCKLCVRSQREGETSGLQRRLKEMQPGAND